MKMKKQWLLLFLLSLLFSVVGCNVSYREEEALRETVEVTEKNSMTVVVNLEENASPLVIENVWLNRNRFIGGILFQGLLIAEENMNNVQPDMCSEFTISPDGLTYVFRLKKELYWHDGEKVTLEDVKWSIETCLASQSVNGYLKKGLQRIDGSKAFADGSADNISGISIEGDNLVIKISQRDDSFLSGLAQLAILPKHCFEGISPQEVENSDFWQAPIGSGPYKFKERISERELLFEINEDYSGNTPNIQEIRCVALENPGEAEFDFAMTSDPSVVQLYEENSSYTVIKSNNLYYRYLMLNVDGRSGKNGELLKNRKIRQALYIGLDRKSIVNNIYKGSAIPLDTGLEEDSIWHVKSPIFETRYNPVLAKRMLKEEGFDFGQTLVLTRYNHDEISVELMEQVANCWRQLGITVEIQPIDAQETDKLWVNTDWYDVGLKNLAAVDYSEWYYEYSSNNTLWSNVLNNREEFDILVNTLSRSNWAYERRELYRQLQMTELDCVYKIPLAIVPQYVIYNNSRLEVPFQELPNLWYYFDIRIEDWELRQ